MGRSLVIDMLSLFQLSRARMSEWLLQPDRFGRAEWTRFKESGINVFSPMDNDIAVGYRPPNARSGAR